MYDGQIKGLSNMAKCKDGFDVREWLKVQKTGTEKYKKKDVPYDY